MITKYWRFNIQRGKIDENGVKVVCTIKSSVFHYYVDNLV